MSEEAYHRYLERLEAEGITWEVDLERLLPGSEQANLLTLVFQLFLPQDERSNGTWTSPSLLTQFPIEKIKTLVQFFIDHRIYNDIVYTEIKRYLYQHWQDEVLQEITQQITDILIETANLPRKEYSAIIRDQYHPRYNRQKHYIYYLFWLYCFYPLLDGYQELILKLVQLVYLDDAQDELMDGLLQIPTEELMHFYPQFLLAVWKSENAITQGQCFDLWSVGTGAMQENVEIIRKLNYDIFNDPLLEREGFWEDERNSKERIREYLH